MPGNRLFVSWDPDSLVPMTDPASFSVDIALSEMNLRSGRWRRVTQLATGESNDGLSMVTIPEFFSQDTSAGEVRPVAIEIVVASTPNVGETQGPLGEGETIQVPLTEAPPTNLLQRLVGAVKRWSPVAYYSLTDRLREPCEAWCAEQPEGIGQEILNRLPPCPRTLEQASASNSGFRRDTGLARFLSQNFFHRGAETCFRQTTFTA